MVVLKKRESFKLFTLIVFYFLVLNSFSQSLDPSFQMPIPVKAASIVDMKIQEDGKMLVAGNIQFYENERVNDLVRLNPDGTLDKSFSYAPDSLINIKGIDLLSTGEVIIFGHSTLMKLNSSGQILTEIDSIKGINTVNIQADDKIIITTSNYNFNSNIWISSLHRFNSDLTIDDNYNQTNRINGQIHAAALQSNKIIVAGEISEVNDIIKNSLVRFEVDGNLDHNFDTGLGTSDFFRAMTVQPDGKILLGVTSFNSFNGISFRGAGIIRLNVNGSVDTDFVIDPQIDYSRSSALIQGTDILVVARLVQNNSLFKYNLCRLKSNGDLDPTFPPIEVFNTSKLILDHSNNIIINSTVDDKKEYLLTRFSSEGQIDNSFNPPLGAYGMIKTGDYFNGTLVVAGDFIRIGDIRTCDLARINSDGSVDPNFIINPSLSRSAAVVWVVTQVTIVDDDTIMVALGNRFVKLNSKGKLDEQFISEDATWDTERNVGRFHRLIDGKIITSSPYGIYRRNPDGSIDRSFQSQSRNSNSRHHLGIQSKGIIYTYSPYYEAELMSYNIRRLNFDGTIDETFNTGSGANKTILDVDIVENNQILATGIFNQYNGVETRGLVKLSEDGQVEETFLKNSNATLPERFYRFYSGTSFRDVYMLNVDDFTPGNYDLVFLQKDGLYNTDYHLPEEIISADEWIVPIVGNADTIILLSKFQLSGQDEPSFALRLAFDDRPVITSTTSELSTPEDTPLELQLSDFIVTDKDSSFPDDFSLILYEGEHYTVEGSRIIPNTDFHGNLTVPVAVSDGKSESDIYNMLLKVIPVVDTVESLTVTISGDSTLTNETLVHISFREQVKDFQASDIHISQGAVSALTTEDSITFTAAITPVSDGMLSVEVPAGVVFNEAGDTNPASSLFVLEYDGTAPNVNLSSLESGNASAFPIHIIFSEVVTGFTADDIRIRNANISELASTDSITFTAQLVPELEGEITIAVPSAAAQDQAGNDNEASESLNLWYEQPSCTLTIEVNLPDQTELPSGTAILYQKIDGKFTVIASKTLANTLAFSDLPEGDYTVGIQPMGDSFLRTYVGNELTLWEAKTINLQQDTVQSISLLESTDDHTSGGCIISGVLLSDPEATSGRILTGNSSAVGEALADVPVYLLHPETRSVLTNTVTGEQGGFSFMDLAIGDYLFVADYEGIPLDETQNLVQIQTDHESISITVIIGANVRITDVQSEKLVTAVEDEIVQHIRYYPNPVEDKIFIEHGSDWIGGEISIHNIIGSLVGKHSIVENVTELKFNGLAPGVYFISLVNGKNHSSFKIHKR